MLWPEAPRRCCWPGPDIRWPFPGSLLLGEQHVMKLWFGRNFPQKNSMCDDVMAESGAEGKGHGDGAI